MCGIAGYVGNKKAVEVLADMLARLEYRGYDSAGLACLAPDQAYVVKQKGKVEALKQCLDLTLPFSTGLAHTRWATHGPPSQTNSHPHFDCHQQFFICHNGIIENYCELRDWLVAEGHVFSSETDSEVAAHLLEEYFEDSFEAAFRRMVARLRGHFAIVAGFRRQPDVLLVTALKNPVIIGITADESLVSSDIPGLLPYTSSLCRLPDGEYAVLGRGTCSFKNQDGQEVVRAFEKCEYELEEAKKEPFPHFMIKEINEEPQAVERALSADSSVAEAATLLQQCARLTFVACGTSYYACMGAKTLLERFGISSQAVIGSEFPYSCLNTLRPGDGVVAVSQSGETADTKLSVEKAKAKGAKVVCVVNVNSSSLTSMSDLKICTYSGPEIGVASTKSYVGQMTVLTMLAVRLAVLEGRLKDHDEKALLEDLRRLPASIEKMLGCERQIKELAGRLKEHSCFLFLGKRSSLSTAYEAALKLKELTYIHAEAFPAGELKHGPLALLGPTVVVIAICDDAELLPLFQNAVQECLSRGAKVVFLGSEEARLEGTERLRLPAVRPELGALASICGMHLLAYHMSVAKGLDPDRPRHLAKSVTVG